MTKWALLGALALAIAASAFALLHDSAKPEPTRHDPSTVAEPEPPPAPETPPQPSPSVTAAPATASAPPPERPEAAPSEEDLMARLRSVETSNPALAVDLVDKSRRRFPHSPDDQERSAILVHALAALGRPNEARGAAEAMVNDGPDSKWVQDVEAFTGAHRHRNLRLDADGGVESY